MGRYAIVNFPKWFNLKSGVSVPYLQIDKNKQNRFAKQPEISGTQIDKSCLALLHTVAEDDLPSVVSLSDYYELPPSFDLKLIRVKFPDLAEAKIRALLLAMLTANYLKGPVFAHLFTQEQLTNFPLLENSTTTLLQAYGVK